jgi:phospholipid/cholesterol/gamma-HCH transport system substrate-binding protein
VRHFATPVRVGILVVLGLVAFFVFLSFTGPGSLRGSTKEYYAYFDDASGLAPRTQVRVAGIPVGEIDRIELAEGRAKVWIRVRADLAIYPNARLAKRSESILGDYLLDLYPGHPEPPGPPQGRAGGRSDVVPARFPAPAGAPAPGAPEPPASGEPLPSGSEIENVKEAVAVEELFDSLNRITEDVEVVTGALRDALAGDRNSLKELVANLERVSATLNETVESSSGRLERILANAEQISDDVRSITADKDEDIGAIVTNIRVITEQTRSVLETVQGIVGANEGELTESMKGLKQALASLNRSLESLETVARKVEQGEGTLGKLVSDDSLAQKVEGVVDDASDLLGRVTRIQTEMTLRSELLLNEEGTKNYFSLRIVPKPDKYYLLEVIDDPRGLVERQTIVRSPPGPEEAANQEVKVTRDTLKWSAQFAKRYGFATFRFGIIESTGGLGMNLHFLEDRLEFKVDVFEFTNPDKTYPRLKAYANLIFVKHLFVTAGADDVINAPLRDQTTGRILSGRDYFVGGGLYFTDDDIKGLIGLLGLL